MGALNFDKHKSASDVKGLLIHCDKNERQKRSHSNQHIDVTKSNENHQFYDLDEAFNRYQKRIEELDKTTNTNKRKNRVTCLSVDVKPSHDFPKDEMDDFFNETYQYFINKFGAKNFINAYVHVDEIHEYVDVDDGKTKMSLPEIHMYFVPEVDGKLNARELFNGKNKMHQYHNDFEAHIQNTFGCDFHTGKAKKTGRSTEELKNMSEQLEIEQMTKELDEVKSNVSFYKNEVQKLKQQKTDLTNDVKALQSDKQQVIDEINEEKQRVLDLIDRFDDVKGQDVVNFDRFETFCADYALNTKGLEVSEKNSKYLRTMKKRYEEDKVKRAKQCKQDETQRLNETSTVSEQRRRVAAELMKQVSAEPWKWQHQEQTSSNEYDGIEF